MRVRRPIVASVAAVIVIAGMSVVANSITTAHALQHPVNLSGVMGRITFVEDETGVHVEGSATGLEPSVGRYVSLVYDLGSVSGGPEACEPTAPIPGMFVGIWSVDDAGDGELIQLNAALAPLSTIDTISIRDQTINGGFGPEAVVACGQIAVHGGRP